MYLTKYSALSYDVRTDRHTVGALGGNPADFKEYTR